MTNLYKILLAKWLSGFGDKLHLIVLPIIIYNRTGSSTYFALALAMESLPWIIVAPFLAPHVERIKTKYTLIVLDILRAVACVIISQFDVGLLLLLVLAFLMGCCSSLFSSFRGKFLSSSIESAQTQRIVGTETSINNIISFSAPVAGGFLLASGLQPGSLLLLDALTYVISAAIIGTARCPAHLPEKHGSLGIHSFIANVKAIFANHKLKPLVVIEVMRNLAEGIFLPLMVVLIVKDLSQPEFMLAWSKTSTISAEILVSVVIAAFGNYMPKRILVVVSTIALAVSVILFPFSSSIPRILFVSFILGIGMGTRQIIAEVTVLNNSTGNRQGQIIATYNSLIALSCVVGNLVSSAMGHTNTATVFVVCGVVLFLSLAPCAMVHNVSEASDIS